MKKMNIKSGLMVLALSILGNGPSAFAQAIESNSSCQSGWAKYYDGLPTTHEFTFDRSQSFGSVTACEKAKKKLQYISSIQASQNVRGTYLQHYNACLNIATPGRSVTVTYVSQTISKPASCTSYDGVNYTVSVYLDETLNDIACCEQNPPIST